jgi:hypothetical protein
MMSKEVIKEIEDLVSECLPRTPANADWIYDEFNWKALRAGLKDIMLRHNAGYSNE